MPEPAVILEYPADIAVGEWVFVDACMYDYTDHGAGRVGQLARFNPARFEIVVRHPGGVVCHARAIRRAPDAHRYSEYVLRQAQGRPRRRNESAGNGQ